MTPRASKDIEPAMQRPSLQFGRRAILVDAGAALLPSLVAAAVAGLLVAGIGGRLAMFILRVTSGSEVIGLESDDGFVIARFTADTFFLVSSVTAGATIVVGPFYSVARLWIPSRWRPLVFAYFFGLVGGGILVHADGVDFTVISPRALAVVLFVAIPAGFGAVLEPLHGLARQQTRKLPSSALLVVAVLAAVPLVLGLGLPGLILVALGLTALLLRQGERVRTWVGSQPFAWAGRLLMLGLAGFGFAELTRDLIALF